MKRIYTINVSINDISYIFMFISSATTFVIFIQNSKQDLDNLHKRAAIGEYDLLLKDSAPL